MGVAFLGYVLPWGTMSYWGATVITTLYRGVPGMVPWSRGGFRIGGPSLYRYSVVHPVLPVPVPVSLVFHVLYIHYIGTGGGTGYGTNNRVYFLVWLVYKDTRVILGTGSGVLVQVFQGIVMLAHPDNSLEASVVYTPLHIVPEWYYLGYYGILKALPGSTSGFLVMVSLVPGYGAWGEPYGTGILLPMGGGIGYTGRYSLVLLLPVPVLWSLWIGVQLPYGIRVSYGRGYGGVSVGCSMGYIGRIPRYGGYIPGTPRY